MGCTVRDKQVRTTRKARSALGRSEVLSDMNSGHNHHHHKHHHRHLQAHANYKPYAEDESTWGYCTEEQLEEILMKNLELLYKEALSKLVGLGYDEDVAMKAILTNGHGYYGGMDVLTNILHNALSYLNGKPDEDVNTGSGDESCDPIFTDLLQLEEYSLAGMVCLLQQVRPHLSRGDAMWCLLMSDLHVGRASSIEIPVSTGNDNVTNENGYGIAQANSDSPTNVVEGGFYNSCGNGVGVVAPTLCRFHGGWGFGNGVCSDFTVNGFLSTNTEMGGQKDIECPKRFNLSPSMKSLLKRNVALFAAGFRANSKYPQTPIQRQSQHSFSVPIASGVRLIGNHGCSITSKRQEFLDASTVDEVTAVLSKFRDLKLDQCSDTSEEGQKDEMILTLVQQVEDLERQVEERKKWAHEKAMQAARKLSKDLTELKLLRMEKEETQRLKKGKQILEDATMKKLSDIENALRKASGKVDRANAAVRRLETENAEIRAEMEASKLSASESVTMCLEVAKREKKCLKKLLAWEKQKTKLQGDITDKKTKVKELQRDLTAVEQAKQDSEEKWRQEVELKEQALCQVEEERRGKEAAEADSKRSLEALRLKIEIDFRRHKDDHQRLEQELSRLRSSVESEESKHHSNAASMPISTSERSKPQGDTIASLLNELNKQDDFPGKGVDNERECILCKKDEVSVVFLPCAHQVVCANCSDSFFKRGKPFCPCCRAPIEQRIRVFGASSY